MVKVRKIFDVASLFHSCAQLTSLFLLSFSFFDSFFSFSNTDYSTPVKSKTTKKGPPPRSNYVGGDNGNALGEKVVVYLPDGYIFCILWVDARLDAASLQFLISGDGRRVVQRQKKPLPPSASAMLSQVYTFARDPKHMVVAQVEAELNRLKVGAQPNKEWDEDTVVDLKEEVLKIFFDVNGTPTNQIQYHRDHTDGRQWISFFVKTVRAQEAPQVGTYCNDDAGMAGGEDDDGITADELRREMEARVRQMGEDMAQRTEDIMRENEERNRQMMEQMFMRMNVGFNNNQQNSPRGHQQQSQEEYAFQQQAAAAHQRRLAEAEALAGMVRPDHSPSV
jgi:hypothetical protein